MNYASDPEWAWKTNYSPEHRQAYENQVMTDRAAHERHRTEFDAVAMAASAFALGAWIKDRSATKYTRQAAKQSRKARAEYERRHRPENYSARRGQYGRELLTFEYYADVAQREIDGLMAEVRELDKRLSQASKKTRGALKARKDALVAVAADKTMALTTAGETLALKYHDILEYDRVISTL